MEDHGTAPHKKPASPCPQGCCRLAQIGPTVDKVIVTDSLWGVIYLSGPSMEAHGVVAAPAQEAHMPAQTLQTLSCLWRC